MDRRCNRAPPLHPALLAIAPVTCDSRVLVLGEHQPSLAETVGFFGGTLLSPASPHGEERGLDAVPDGTVDLILITPALPADVPGESGTPRTADEWTRVLRTSGAALLVTDERAPWAASMSGFRTGSHSMQDLLTGLKRAGFMTAGRYELLPTLDRISSFRRDGIGFLPRLKKHVAFARNSLRAGRAVRAGSALLLTRSATLPQSPVEAVAASEMGASPESVEVRRRSYSVTFQLHSSFVKLPISAHGLDLLTTQEQTIRDLRTHPVSAFLPTPVRRRTTGEIDYLVFPMLYRCTYQAALQGIASAVDVLAGSTATRVLRNTDLWTRIFSPVSLCGLSELGGEWIPSVIERRIGGRKLPCGVVHGDLHMNNVLLDASGSTRIIDWDWAEMNSPHVIDLFEVLVSVVMNGPISKRSDALSAAIGAVVRGGNGLPFDRALRRALGELTRAEAAALFLVHRTTRRFRFGWQPARTDRETISTRLRFCRELLET